MGAATPSVGGSTTPAKPGCSGSTSQRSAARSYRKHRPASQYTMSPVSERNNVGELGPGYSAAGLHPTQRPRSRTRSGGHTEGGRSRRSAGATVSSETGAPPSAGAPASADAAGSSGL